MVHCSSIVRALALLVILVATHSHAGSPEILVEDEHLVVRLSSGKMLAVQRGLEGARDVLGELDKLREDVDGGLSDDDIETLRAALTEDLAKATKSLGQSINATKAAVSAGDDAVRSELNTAISAGDDAVRSELSSTITAGDDALRNELNATISAGDDAVRSELGETISTGDEAVRAELGGDIARVRRLVDGSDPSNATLYNQILLAFQRIEQERVESDLATCQAALAALENSGNCDTGGGGGGSSDTTLAAFDTALAAVLPTGCDENVCSSVGGSNVNAYARGDFFPNVAGLYFCRFTVGLVAKTTPAVATQMEGNSIASFTCATPAWTTTEVETARFEAAFSLVEGTRVMRFMGGDNLPTITFQTQGPVMALDSAIYLSHNTINTAPNFVINVPFAISDVDSPLDLITYSVSGHASPLVEGSITVTSTGADGIIGLNFGRAQSTNFQVSLMITASDNHQNARNFQLNVSGYAEAVAVNLHTTDGTVRRYADTSFWETLSTVGSQTGNFLSSTDFIRPAYHEPLGSRIKLQAHMNGAIIATAMYDVRKQFYGVSLRDLLSGAVGNHVVFADKDVASSSGTVLQLLSANNGDSGPTVTNNVGDLFFDFNDALMAHATSWGNANTNKIRLITDKSLSGAYGPGGSVAQNTRGHVYGGIGVDHYHGTWCGAFEYAPNMGYCPVYNMYGDSVNPGFGGCANYVRTGCNGPRIINLNLAISVHV
eukprot:m.289173 g.289173  ORF g.289173 m.289173 type:complete len:720 (+) comp12087_c0_seq1:156-2315(+)